jgi:alpha-galactosidase/6-phospho-beta-glucosidase family protein
MDAQHLKQKSRVTRIFSTLQAENERLRRSEESYKTLLTDAATSLRTASADVDSVKKDLLMSIGECSRLEKELLVTKEESSQEKIRAEKAETELEEMKKRVEDLEKLTKEAEERENVAKTRYERVKERVTESVNVIASLLYTDSSKSM